MNDNKYTYFAVSVDIPNRYGVNIKSFKENIENKMDLVLYSMNSTPDIIIFKEVNNKKLIYFFKSSKRKRFGQLVRLLEKHLTKKAFMDSVDEFKNNVRYSNKIESTDYIYKGDDLRIFSKKKLYPWQEELKNKLYYLSDSNNKSFRIRKGDNRTIIHIYDPDGNNGKSSFVKYLLYLDMIGRDFNNNLTLDSNQIGAFSIGSSSQLKSAAYNMGPKKLYLIDLPRSLNKDLDLPSLMGSLEMLKNGSILGVNMYGSGKSLLFEPPIIVLFSNYLLDFNSLSSDRWSTFKINSKNKSLKDITGQLSKINAQINRRKRRIKRSKRVKKQLVTLPPKL